MRSNFLMVHHMDTDTLYTPSVIHFCKNRIRKEREERRGRLVQTTKTALECY